MYFQLITLHIQKDCFSYLKTEIIEQYDNILSVKGPAINLDKRGFFKKPKLIESYKVDENNDYNIFT